MSIFSHSSSNPCTLNGILDAPFLVAIAPENDRRMIAIALNHVLQQAQMFCIDTCQSVFIDNEDTFSVTDIQLSRRHGVVGGAIGITSECL